MKLRPVGAVLLAMGGFFGCAVGTSATGHDGGATTDSGTNKDSATPSKDSGAKETGPVYDSGPPPPPPQDSGSPCGTCLGNTNVCCGSTCVDTTNDSNNCGTCNNVCSGTTCCNSSCTNTTNDINNCGTCGNTCGSGMTCVNSTCQGGNNTCTIDKASCSHSPCTTGAALSQFCDLSDEGIVFYVCLDIPSCCSSTWDASCVSDGPSFYEINGCIGSGC